MIRTRVCELLGIQYPILQAGMAASFTSPQLVAAVSNAGGLGILGCLSRSTNETATDVGTIRHLTDRPFGVNFVLHHCEETTFAVCLKERVPVFSFFGGDPAEAVRRAHDAGAKVVHQVTTLSELEHARNVGVDVLVAQGYEAGGHVGPLPLFSFLPEAVEAAGDQPVVAAGGIVDGRGLAAVLCLGASGVLMGTRFLATPEAPTSTAHKQAILDANGTDATVASEIFDILWQDPWPGVKVRALRNRLVDRWYGHETDLRSHIAEAKAAYEQATDPQEKDLLAGMGTSRIRELKPAGKIVTDIIREAEQILQTLGR